MDWDSAFRDELERIEAAGLRRVLREHPRAGGRLNDGERELLNFSSNDYLNLASDPRLAEAAAQAVHAYGTGASASRLMAGHLPPHAQLESALATLARMESAVVFPTGFQANLGVLCTVAGAGDAIFSDRLNHASIIDGARLSRAAIHIYDHRDMTHLEQLLRDAPVKGRRIIVSDALFSMDGDLAPVHALHQLAKTYEALLVIDEAHAMGVFGEGAGLCQGAGLRPDVLVGTLSKALGSMGGFLAGSRALCDLLITRARSFIYTTGLSPACAGAAIAAIEIVRESPESGAELLRRSRFFHHELSQRGVPVMPSQSQVIPIHVGENEAAVQLADALREAGLIITGIRPPTVPPGTARLRLSVTLAHEEQHLCHAATLLANAFATAGRA
ncbi:MAG: 8-amino-7-oxononanoate synthase [Candidatus Hydrogenedentes bacterium]|nr:8-amino-7-oxononanoate synthase [Candidatus Hydrogenedentota bacterium]